MSTLTRAASVARAPWRSRRSARRPSRVPPGARRSAWSGSWRPAGLGNTLRHWRTSLYAHPRTASAPHPRSGSGVSAREPRGSPHDQTTAPTPEDHTRPTPRCSSGTLSYPYQRLGAMHNWEFHCTNNLIVKAVERSCGVNEAAVTADGHTLFARTICQRSRQMKRKCSLSK